MSLSLILFLIGILSSVLIGKKFIKFSGKFSGLFSSLFILGILAILFFLAVLFDEDLEIIKTVHAESDNESDSEKKPKRDKGKGKATDFEYLDRNPPYNSSNEEIAKDKANFELRKQQEDHDYKLAQLLQEQEYINESVVESDSDSDYSVYSSEIHSDDSENTVNKKRAVMEYDKNESNKRKPESGSDNEKPESKHRKIFPKK